MFAIVELKTAVLDFGIPGVSAVQMLLLFAMALWIPMIPYALLYISLRDKQANASRSLRPSTNHRPLRKMMAWVDEHRHTELLHH